MASPDVQRSFHHNHHSLSGHHNLSSQRKRSLESAFPILLDDPIFLTNTTQQQVTNTFGFTQSKRSRVEQQQQQQQQHHHHHPSHPTTHSLSDTRKRSMDSAFPIPPSTLMNDSQGFAGFEPVKRHQTHAIGQQHQHQQQQQQVVTSSSSSSSSSSTKTSTSSANNNNNNNINNNRKRGVDDAFPMQSSGTFHTGAISLMDAGQGFAGFSPMKRLRVQQSTFGLEQQQQQIETITTNKTSSSSSSSSSQKSHSPDENRQPSLKTSSSSNKGVLGSVSGNKRGRHVSNTNDVVMQCTPLKRGHHLTNADVELDRPCFSKRYIQQIEQHLKYQQSDFEIKLRRDCAAEIAAVKAKAARTAADTSSRIAVENERLRHENFVLKSGIQIQQKQMLQLQTENTQLKHANYAICLRNAGGHHGNGGNVTFK
tara:strand:- start:183 stop:1457 length:1275 start_codon:yes stop_codon:yes gene_type:complete